MALRYCLIWESSNVTILLLACYPDPHHPTLVFLFLCFSLFLSLSHYLLYHLLSIFLTLFRLSLSPPSPSRRACCLRFCARRKTLKQRPSRCWSTCAPCRTSCSCRRPSAIASIRRRGSVAWRRPQRWAPLHSSALHPADLCRYQRCNSYLCMFSCGVPVFTL